MGTWSPNDYTVNNYSYVVFQAGCDWEGKFQEYEKLKSTGINFDFQTTSPSDSDKCDVHPFKCTVSPTQSLTGQPTHGLCDTCCEPVRLCELQSHLKMCPLLLQGRKCPLGPLGCPSESYMDHSELAEHLQDREYNHLTMLANCIQLLANSVSATQTPHNEVDDNMNTLRVPCPLPEKPRYYYVEPPQQLKDELKYLVSEETKKIQNSLILSFGEKLQTRDEEVACLLYTSPSPRDATLSRMPSSA